MLEHILRNTSVFPSYRSTWEDADSLFSLHKKNGLPSALSNTEEFLTCILWPEFRSFMEIIHKFSPLSTHAGQAHHDLPHAGSSKVGFFHVLE